MIRLSKAVRAWGAQDFEDVLKTEIEQLDPAQLPLQRGLSSSSYVTDSKFDVMIISVTEQPRVIRARAGIFYGGIVAGCSCADDPTPVEEQSEYCAVSYTHLTLPTNREV